MGPGAPPLQRPPSAANSPAAGPPAACPPAAGPAAMPDMPPRDMPSAAATPRDMLAANCHPADMPDMPPPDVPPASCRRTYTHMSTYMDAAGSRFRHPRRLLDSCRRHICGIYATPRCASRQLWAHIHAYEAYIHISRNPLSVNQANGPTSNGTKDTGVLRSVD